MVLCVVCGRKTELGKSVFTKHIMSELQTHAYGYACTPILSPSGRTTVSSVRENRLFNWHVEHMQI